LICLDPQRPVEFIKKKSKKATDSTDFTDLENFDP
jgi:hypothetical protein